MQPAPAPSPKHDSKPPIKEQAKPAAEALIEEQRAQLVEITAEDLKQAEKRGLEPEQWSTLVDMVEILQPGVAIPWIDRNFQFENGEIHFDGGLKFLNQSSLFRLPNRLKIEGPLRITEAMIRTLPKGLVVTETLWILGCDQLESIPDDLSIGGALWANHNPRLKRVPAYNPFHKEKPDFYPSNVSLADCKSLNTLDKGFKAKGLVTLDQSPISTLPAEMEVGGLSLVGCPITYLPNDLVVHGDLILSKDAPNAVKKKAEELKRRNPSQIEGRIEYK